MKKIQYKLDDIKTVARDLYQDIKGVPVVTLTGGLGAGKTTLIRELVAAMGGTQVVTSPTYTYFNVYHLPNRQMVYHFDLYRLKNTSEFENAGFFEYLYQPNSVAFIEWPEVVNTLLNRGVCRLDLKVVGQQDRILTYDCI